MPQRRGLSRSLWDGPEEMNTRCYPGSGPSWRGKTPTSCLGSISLLGEITVQGVLRELEVANYGYCSTLQNPNLPTPLPEHAPPPFIGVQDLFPQISWREGSPHGDEGGGRVHDKARCTIKQRVHGRGPWHGAASPKLKRHRPARMAGWRYGGSRCAPR